MSNCLLCSWNKGCFFFSFVICVHCSMWLLFQILWSSIVLEINCFGCPFYNICPLLKVIEETRFAWTSYLKWKTWIDSEWLMGIDQFCAYPWGSLKYIEHVDKAIMYCYIISSPAVEHLHVNVGVSFWPVRISFLPL